MTDSDVDTVEVDWILTKTSIVKRINKIFQRNPNLFFTEHDIHSVLYNIAEEELQRHGVLSAKTSDSREVSLVHHEYPTPFRCCMKGYGFQLKYEKPYRRGHYDLVILNPSFVKNYELPVVYGKDYQRFSLAMQEVTVEPLIWVCEVVFFPKVKGIPKNALRIIKQDALKVKETLKHKVGRDVNFCKMGSVLVFINHTAKGIADLKRQIDRLAEHLNLEVILATAQ